MNKEDLFKPLKLLHIIDTNVLNNQQQLTLHQ